MVTDVDRNGITVKDSDGTTRRIESACKVWSAGVSASPLGQRPRRAVGRRTRPGRPSQGVARPVVPGHPNVFVIGDMAAVDGVPGHGAGRHPGRQVRHAARIKAELGGADPADREPFQYFDKGSMATVSRFSAVAQVGPVEFGGFIAWLAWLVLHLLYLVGFKTKVSHAAVLDGDLPGPRPRPAHHHRAAGVRPHPDRATGGSRRPRRSARRPGARASRPSGRPARCSGVPPPASASTVQPVVGRRPIGCRITEFADHRARCRECVVGHRSGPEFHPVPQQRTAVAVGVQ